MVTNRYLWSMTLPTCWKIFQIIWRKLIFEINGKIVSWQYIVDFYNFDKTQQIQMAPKLKDKHIDLPPFSTMHVNLAAEVLSHSVAAGISTLVSLKHLPESAMYTAQFVEQFDALFKTFNSWSLKSSQRLGHAFNDSSGHHAFLREHLDFLSKLKTIECKELPCIYGWKISINALFGLWQHLKKEEKFWFILTGRQNQDCVENLFSIIRGKGGFCDNPDVEQFKAAFKYLIADKLFVQSDTNNSKVDNDTILLNISNVAMAKYIKTGQIDVKKPQIPDVAMVTAVPSSLPTKTWQHT